MREGTMIKNDPALELWKYFSRHVSEIAAAYSADDYEWLDRKLSPLIKAIAADMNWEIGPYNHPDQTFVLSPTIRENLPVSKAAIALAPSISGWVFVPAKPAKDLLSLSFEARGFKVNANEWRYRMTSYNDGEFVDIELFFEPSSSPPASYENMFCELVVEALLGEELRLDRVGYLKPISVRDMRSIEKASQIRYLKAHIGDVLAPIQ
jgi:hypothetical protein